MLQAVPQLDTLVVAIGGGGLIGGIAAAAEALKPGIRVIGCRPCASPICTTRSSMRRCPRAGRPSPRASSAGRGITQALVERYVDDILLVDEGDVEQADRDAAGHRRRWWKAPAPPAGGRDEGAGAFRRTQGRAGAGRRQHRPDVAGGHHPARHGARRALARLRVCARDVPGSLARITAVVSEAGANIDEVHHQRAFTLLAAQNVEIELVVQTAAKHMQSLLEALKAAGFEAEEQ